MLAPDFPDEVTAEIENEHYDWDFYGDLRIVEEEEQV